MFNFKDFLQAREEELHLLLEAMTRDVELKLNFKPNKLNPQTKHLELQI